MTNENLQHFVFERRIQNSVEHLSGADDIKIRTTILYTSHFDF